MATAPLAAGWALRQRNLPGPYLPAGEPGPPAAAFPAAARQILVELFVGGAWVDISGYVYQRDPVQISRGISPEANVADPATLALTVDNRDGRFSPRNPTGPWYKLIGRNTPIRVRVAGYWAAGWRTRFYGEVSAWPQRWEPTGNDVWVPLEAAGVLRRLTQGETVARSVLYRRILRYSTSVKAYWPCEDESGAATLASGLTAGTVMTYTGSPSLAADSSYGCTAPILTLGTAKLVGQVGAYPSSGQAQLRFLLHVPAAGTVDNTVLARLACAGVVTRVDVVYGLGGFISVLAYDYAGGSALSVGAIGAIDGVSTRISVEIDTTRVAGTIDIALRIYDPVAGGISSTSGSAAGGYSITAVTSVTVNPAAANLADVGMGHITVQADLLTTVLAGPVAYLFDELKSYAGETAGDRLLRLGVEEGLPVRVVGGSAGTLMGVQRPDTLVNLLQECATTDGGLLFEPRDEAGLAYRTRDSLSNRAASLTLAYHGHQMTGLEPVDDDRATRNDVTVTRRGGSSARASLETGSLSAAAPPAGVGRYTSSTEVNTSTDAVLTHHAGWRLHLGTVDEARYPAVGLNLATPELAADQATSEAVLDLDIGGRLVVTGMPGWLPPDDVSAGVQGLSETLSTFTHEITVNGVPESPWHVGVYDDRARPAVGTDPSFEAGTNGGTAAGFFGGPAPAIAQSALHPTDGTKTCDIAWAAGGQGLAAWTMTGLNPGTSYTATADAYVPAGSPDVNLGVGGITFGSQYSTKDATFTMSVTFTATAASHDLQVIDQTPGGAGTHAYIDFLAVTDGTGDPASRYTSAGTTLRLGHGTSTTTLGVTTPAGPLWTTSAADMPFDILVAGERMRVTRVTTRSDISASAQDFTVIRSVNGVVKSHAIGEAVELFRPVYFSL